MSSKLKLPGGQGLRLGAELEVTIPSKSMQLKTCLICKKGFSSGKALGGHMRMHKSDQKRVNMSSDESPMSSSSNPQQDSPSFVVPVATCNNNNGGSVDTSKKLAESSEQVCPVCYKEFRSKKSLHGHMRCHPERQWRGIKRPLLADKIEVDNTFDILKGLRGWMVTGKRGRSGLSSASTTTVSLLEEDVVEGACGLMSLAFERDWNLPEFVERAMKKQRIQLCTNRGSSGEKSGVEVNGEAPRREKSTENSPEDKLSLNEELGQEMDWKLVDNERSGSRLPCEVKLEQKTKGIEIKNGINKYKKRAKGRKKKREKLMIRGESEGNYEQVLQLVDDNQAAAEVDGGVLEQLQQDIDQYRCKVCAKHFFSGQALGGHQRLHWAGPPLMLLDLNQVPPMELHVAGRSSAALYGQE